jgi:hypothetical protein
MVRRVVVEEGGSRSEMLRDITSRPGKNDLVLDGRRGLMSNE